MNAEEAKRLFETGRNRQQVADELGVSYQVACRYLREAKVPAWPDAGPERVARINSLLQSGVRQNAIADMLHVSPQRIQQIKAKNHLPKRLEANDDD